METPEGGLGPIFNDRSCAACHTAGGIGNACETTVTRFGQVADGKLREMRTAPLWGLRARTALLHDGRAKTVTEAITQHDGAAAASRRRFEALSPREVQQLLADLKTI